MREEINIAHKIIAPLTLSWPSSKPRQTKILRMSLPPTPIGSGPVQAPTLLAVREWRDLRQGNSEGEKETPSSKTDSERLYPSCRDKKVTIQQSFPSQGKTETPQKTIPRKATLERVPCIRYPTIFRENLCRLYSTQELYAQRSSRPRREAIVMSRSRA